MKGDLLFEMSKSKGQIQNKIQLSLKGFKSQTNLTSLGLHDYLLKPTYLNLVISKNMNHGTWWSPNHHQYSHKQSL